MDVYAHAVKGIRGCGLMLGFILSDGGSIELVKQLMEAGLLTVPAGPNIVRWLPPLNVTEAEIDKALEIMESGLTSSN